MSQEELKEKDIGIHTHHWIENLYCKTCRKKLTDDEIFNMGFNWALSEMEPRHQELVGIDEATLRDIVLDGFVELVDHCNNLNTITPYGVPNDITARLVDKISQTFGTPKELSLERIKDVIKTETIKYVSKCERKDTFKSELVLEFLFERANDIAKAILNHVERKN